MIYVYYDSSGIVESMIQFDPGINLKPEDNLQPGQSVITLNQTMPNDYSTYVYKIISGNLVRGDKRQNII